MPKFKILDHQANCFVETYYAENAQEALETHNRANYPACDHPDTDRYEALEVENHNGNWVSINDEIIRHVWHDDIGKEHYVLPDSYHVVGVPIDADSGNDMTYVRTEILKLEK